MLLRPRRGSLFATSLPRRGNLFSSLMWPPSPCSVADFSISSALSQRSSSSAVRPSRGRRLPSRGSRFSNASPRRPNLGKRRCLLRVETFYLRVHRGDDTVSPVCVNNNIHRRRCLPNLGSRLLTDLSSPRRGRARAPSRGSRLLLSSSSPSFIAEFSSTSLLLRDDCSCSDDVTRTCSDSPAALTPAICSPMPAQRTQRNRTRSLLAKSILQIVTRLQARRRATAGPGKTFSRGYSGEKFFKMFPLKMAHFGVL